MPKKPMSVGPPGKEGPSPPPPRAPDLPGGPSGPGSSESQRNPPPQEGGLPVSALVAKLITDIQVGIQAAFLQQVESTSREIEMLRALPEERLAEYLVPENEVVAEFQRLFQPAERTETLSRISAGVQYKSAVPEKGQEEDPPIKRLTGYEIKPEDVRQGRITPEGEKRIIEHIRMKIAKERLEAVKEVYRRGVPYILVDHGKITVKLAFYASPQESSQTQERSAKPASEFSGAVRPEAVPLKIEARVVNEKNVEALGREAGAIGEIEISFKVDLR
jgi:hypothetical protein